ncbi:hypothetical protein [Paenibacillus shenyangensis]|uniref:hypothetical protein n=1 Tax=Paenibacillus sp. A9 TaxID=1284352 RepID=UPI00037EBA40|nr:hypothetical protein [Paenibacillus sp. A9]
MKAIGLRVSPNEIFYCVSEKNNENVDIVAIDSLIVPKALHTPEKLAYVRINLISLFNMYQIEYAGIRIPEGTAKNPDINRTYLEGVVQELLASCNVKMYFLGRLTSISSRLNESMESIKSFITGDNDLIEIEGLLASAKEKRESILVSLVAAELGGQ